MLVGSLFTLPDGHGRLEAIHGGHLAVHQDQIELLALQDLQGVGAVGHRLVAQPQVVQHGQRHLLVDQVVFGQQHPPDEGGRRLAWIVRCRRLCWRLRLLQPLHHGVVEIRLTNRLGQILAVGAGLHATARQGIARGAEDDDRHLRQGCIALHPRQQAEAILFRHHHVGQQHVEGGVDHLSLLEQGHRLADVLRQGYLAVPGGQLMRQDLQIGGVVIDHQHLELIKLARARRQAVTLLQRQGQGEEELAAAVAIAMQLDVPLHHLYQALGDGQPQAGAAEAPRSGAVCLTEGLKQFVLPLRRDADAGILDREAAGHLLLILSQQLDADHHLTAFGELDGVAHQVGQHLAEPLAVAEQMDGMERRRAEDLQPLAVGNRGKALDQIL